MRPSGDLRALDEGGEKPDDRAKRPLMMTADMV
jgi:hypothetical protein